MMPSGERAHIRVGLIAAASWLAPIFLSALSSQKNAVGRCAGNVASLLFAPLVVLLAVALGDRLLALLLQREGKLPGRWLFAAGLGLGGFSLATLLVGVVLLPPTPVVWALLILGAVILARTSGRVVIALWTSILRWAEGRNWAEAVLVALVALLVFLNALRAFIPPIEYDEMEYHLAAPAKYVRQGRVSFIWDNAYASFPANVEMLFLDAMLIRGGVEEGFALGRLLNVALGVLAACAAGACAAAIFGHAASVPAAAILYTWPAVNTLALAAYVELGLLLYVGLALLAAYVYAREQRPAQAVLLGIVCGLAAGCKYPAVLFVCVAACLWVVAMARAKWAMHGAVFAAAAFLTFSPWLIRNVVNTENPVYPLAWKFFNGGHWSDRKEARWQKAHTAADRSLAGMWRSLRRTATERYPREDSPRTMSVLLVVLLPLAFVRRGWRTKAGVLVALAALCVLGWLMFTHRITRFLLPWLVPLVLVNAAGAVALEGTRRLGRAVGIGLVVLALLEARATYSVRLPAEEFEVFRGRYGAEELYARLFEHASYGHDAITFINRLPAGSRVLFYGEARTLYCTGDVVAPTVFDENPLDAIVDAARSEDDILAGLKARGVTHLYVNLVELHRLQWSYAFRHGGRDWPGYTVLRDPAEGGGLLRRFLARHCSLAYPRIPAEVWRRIVARDAELPAERRMDPAPMPAEEHEEYLGRAFVHFLSETRRERPPRMPTPFFVYALQQ